MYVTVFIRVIRKHCSWKTRFDRYICIKKIFNYKLEQWTETPQSVKLDSLETLSATLLNIKNGTIEHNYHIDSKMQISFATIARAWPKQKWFLVRRYVIRVRQVKFLGGAFRNLSLFVSQYQLLKNYLKNI